MARTGEGEELPSVAELVDLSQTKPLMIRGELFEKLAEETPEPSPEPEPEPRAEDAPPADRSRRAHPFVLAAGAVVALGLAAVVLLQPRQVAGTPAAPPNASVPPPPPVTSTEAIQTMSATAAPPTLTAGLRDSPVRTTDVPAGAGRKPAKEPTPSSTTTPAEEQWRDYFSSVLSSWQHQPRNPWGR